MDNKLIVENVRSKEIVHVNKTEKKSFFDKILNTFNLNNKNYTKNNENNANKREKSGFLGLLKISKLKQF